MLVKNGLWGSADTVYSQKHTDVGHVREEGVPIMTSNFAYENVGVAGMSMSLRAHEQGHPAHPIAIAAAAPRKRAADATIVASVRGFF